MPLLLLEEAVVDDTNFDTAFLVALFCKYRVSNGVLSFCAVMVTGGGKVDASLDISDMDNGDSPVDDTSLRTVGGS